jgi:quercetin dioxygenase-like cupin family protein
MTNTFPIDLTSLCRTADSSGPQWSQETEDLDMTVLSWNKGKTIVAHTNHEVDVLVVVLEGIGEVTVNGETHALQAGQALVIPKGAERSFFASGDCFRYLSIHKRRLGLHPVRRAKQ